MFIPGAFSPGMIMDRMIEDCFIQSHGGRLYGIKSTGQVLCVVLITQKGLNPSIASPNWTLRGSEAK